MRDMTSAEARRRHLSIARVYLAATLLLVTAGTAGAAFTTTGSLATGRAQATATRLPDGKVLVAGGEIDHVQSRVVAELYDPATGTFSPTGNMVNGRSGHTATLLPDGTVLMVGGYGVGAATSAEIYNPATGRFSTTGSLGIGRTVHTATLLPDGCPGCGGLHQ
jgi:hypothetical protein